MADLFSQPSHDETENKPVVLNLGQGIFHIKGLAPSQLLRLHVDNIIRYAPLRHMMTPMGHEMKVKTSNCGPYGWIADINGYRYSKVDPLTQKAWPCIPAEFLQIHKYACRLAGLSEFTPDACLINHYKIGHAMGRHVDKDEKDTSWPIISISLGLSAEFQVFGKTRNSSGQSLLLEDGDVVILSGPARHYYHGVKTIKADGLQPNLTERINLTLRKSH